MNDHNFFQMCAIALCVLVIFSGCSGPDETPQVGGDSDSESDSDSDSNSTVLSSGHDGWNEPNCWDSDCHASDGTHNSGLDPYECVECHGNNGTKSEHHKGENCSECHNNPGDHPDDSFPEDICKVCHS